MKNKKHIDDLFRDKLGHYSEVPPADAWGDMDKRLDTLVPQAAPTTSFRWLGHVAMVSAIAVLSVSLITKYVSNKNENSISTNEQNINSLETNNSTVSVGNSKPAATATNVPSVTMEQGSEAVASDNAAAATSSDNTDQDGGNNGNSGSPANTMIASVSSKTSNSATSAKNGTRTGGTTAGSKGGRQANYTPYHSGMTTVSAAPPKGGSAEPLDDESNSEINEVKGENKSANNTVYQSVVGNAETTSHTPMKAAPAPNAGDLKQYENSKDARKHSLKPSFVRWSAGVKLGYERGFNTTAATKYVVSPYVQYNLSPKAAIMVQPAVKYANRPEHVIDRQSYYVVNNDGAVQNLGTKVDPRIEGSSVVTYYTTKYRFSQSHDSIVKTNKVGGTYMEYEVPVLFRYNVTKKTAVYGGPNIVYSKVKGVTEETYTKAGIIRTVDTSLTARTMPATPDMKDIITYNGTPYNTYGGPLYPAPATDRIRFGAIVGISYEYSDRWLLDALVQKNPSPKDVRGGYNINAPLSATYFRLSVGYKLAK